MSAELLVVAALPAEVAPLLGCFRLTGEGRVGPARWHEGTLDGRRLAVVWTGDGAACATAGLETALDSLSPTRVLVVGVAGGLSPELEIGDLVLADRVYDEHRPAPSPDRSMIELAATYGGLAGTGAVVSVPRIATSAADKAALWRQHGEPSPAVVDLETAAYARVAHDHGVPYLAVRAVSDVAGETLALDFERFRGGDGRVGQLAVAGHALRHPSLIPRLLELRRRVASCAAALADFVTWYSQETTDSDA